MLILCMTWLNITKHRILPVQYSYRFLRLSELGGQGSSTGCSAIGWMDGWMDGRLSE
jgi:hypothetical protein